MNNIQLKLHRLLHWEYWPFGAVYYPVFAMWFYYALRARSLFFFSAANPSIKNGGMAMESKMEIYDLIPQQYIPRTILAAADERIESVVSRATAAGISYPLIAKPDIGLKAYAVREIRDTQELADYQKMIGRDFLVQELISYPGEIGIFYVRMPDEKTGIITGIVSKEFLSITGNGKDTMTDLIKKNARSYAQLPQLKKMYGDGLNKVLPGGERFVLVPFGSHTRGSMFLDHTAMVNEKLLRTFDDICNQIPGFYFGRLDIRYASFDELCEGKNFSIIEINGAGSEPTHMYDPRHSIFFAWRELIRHWRLLYEVSVANHKKGHPYLTYAEGMAMVRANAALEDELKVM